MHTQWRVGFSGATGLDYAVLPAVLELIGVPVADRSDTFVCLQIMELHALALMRKKNG